MLEYIHTHASCTSIAIQTIPSDPAYIYAIAITSINNLTYLAMENRGLWVSRVMLTRNRCVWFLFTANFKLLSLSHTQAHMHCSGFGIRIKMVCGSHHN